MNIVFAGNRQCEFIASVFRTLVSQRADLSITHINDDGDVPDRTVDVLRSANIVVLQERGLVRNFELDEINKDVCRIGMPEISVDFLWPFGGQPHLLNLPARHLPDGPFPATLGDAYLNRRIQAQQLPELLSKYLSLRIENLIDLDGYKDSVLGRQAKIDQISATDWASVINDNMRQRPIFLNPLQPTAWVLHRMLSQLLPRMNLGISISDDNVLRACATAPELPIHPSVARYFNLSWASDGRYYQLRDSDIVSFAEYARRYLAYTEGGELEIGVRATAVQDYGLAFNALSEAVERPLGGESVSAQHSLARALIEKGDIEKANRVLAKAKAIEPTNTAVLLASARIFTKLGRLKEAEIEINEYFAKAGSDSSAYVILADIYIANGKSLEAVNALRTALTMPNAGVGLQSRLTLALARIGDLNAACESAEVEIKLAPSDPHPRAFLSEVLIRLGRPEAAKSHIESALTILSDSPEFEGLRTSLRSLYIKLDPPLRDDLL